MAVAGLFRQPTAAFTAARGLASSSSIVSSSSSPPATSKMVEVERCEETQIASVVLKKKPVNSYCTEFSRQLSSAIREVEHGDAHGRSKAILIKSDLTNGIFSAGLDLAAVYAADEEGLTELWSALQDTGIDVFHCSLPVAVAINGHAIAGGAPIPTTADYKVMVDNPKYTVGLNEAKFGLIAPPWFIDSFRANVGHRFAEKCVVKGSLISAKKAYEVGLVDELAKDGEEAVEKCKKELMELIKMDNYARHTTKMSTRHDIIERFHKCRQKDIEFNVKLIMNSKKKIGAYLDSLKKK